MSYRKKNSKDTKTSRTKSNKRRGTNSITNTRSSNKTKTSSSRKLKNKLNNAGKNIMGSINMEKIRTSRRRTTCANHRTNSTVSKRIKKKQQEN